MSLIIYLYMLNYLKNIFLICLKVIRMYFNLILYLGNKNIINLFWLKIVIKSIFISCEMIIVKRIKLN